MLQRAHRLVPDALLVSAHTKAGLDTLEARCVELIADSLAETELIIPHSRYDVVARLHKLGHIHEQEHEDDGVHIKGRFPATQAGFFAPFVVKK
jgi:GTP-binding protein HflX